MKKIRTLLLITLPLLLGISIVNAVPVPDYYKANYSIANDWENIKKIFIEIEANNQIGEETSPESFNSLYHSFNNVFPKFPQEYNFQIVYQKCKTLSQNLSSIYNQNIFASFMDNCFRPLSTILNTIDSSYTVKPNITVNPSTWPAPLTVTLSATNSVDPSSETIPENNYYWYYRDVNWVDQAIWNKSVLNYTFTKAWTHIVHLTVRSSNYNNWIFDWEKDVSIVVKPMSASISVYANWKKLSTTERTKFGTQEWLNWIILDWSATIPIWWRKLETYQRKIVWWNWFSLVKNWEWVPWIIKVLLPNEGEYKITLTTRDNEWNSIFEEYSIVLADPVAIIKQSPEVGSTSNTFTFDASSSYSVTSSVRLYTWEIFDSNWNKKTTYQWKTIKYQFVEPGNYTVKLTVTDNLWESNTETTQVYVESSDPIAQFTYTPDSNRKYASKFLFDASASSDVDAINWVDELTYSWIFSNPEVTTINSLEWNNRKVKVSFDSVWEHTVKLIVTDKYGKSSSIEKKIVVESILRPEMLIAPVATTWWTPINIMVQSNQNILNYSRNFGDWSTVSTQSNKIQHVFSKVWNYKITLTVYGEKWDTNTITETVFIWEKNMPTAAYKLRNWSSEIIKQNEECVESTSQWNVVHPAYRVFRYNQVTIDPSDSVNTKWTSSDLKFFFKPKYGDIYNTSTFKHTFSELWCSYVDMTVEDSAMWVSSSQRIWFKTYNSLPTLDNVTLSFPQYWNWVWIGLNQASQNTIQDIFNWDTDLTVKVTASNAKDADWFISYFKWYYYYKDDPSRRLETKITPSTVNYTYFQIKEAWEYMFWVTIYDNDDWKTVSEEVLWNWPIVLLTQDSKNVDIPIVTLRSNKTTVEVWDEVTFNVSAKIISDRADFQQERTIRYDFDWDWERDLVTKDDEVTYIYEKPEENWYIPRVSVLYRWYVWSAKWWSIIVKDALRPRLLYTAAWNFVLFRDISLWWIEKTTICLSLLDCKKNNDWYVLVNTGKASYFTFKYPEYEKYFVSVDLEDEYANLVNKKMAITLNWITTDNWKVVNYTWDIKLLTIPEYQEKEDGTMEIFVGNSLDNSVLYYVLNEKNDWDCYVDLDITDDIERDFSCNETYLKKYSPKYKNKTWRIYYTKNGSLVYKEFSVFFLDYSVKLSEEEQAAYDKISWLLQNVEDENLRILLLNLQDWLISETETEANTIALQEYLNNEKNLKIDDLQKNEIQDLVGELSNSTVVDAMWWTEYDKAKLEILLVLPKNLRTRVSGMFSDFEIIEADYWNWLSQQDKRKEKLQEILNLIISKTTDDLENQGDDEIAKADLDGVVVPNICKIMGYYEIASTTNLCDGTQVVKVPEATDVEKVSKNKLSTWLKVLIITLSSLICIFVVLVIFFAVKAKINRQRDEEE